MTNPTLSLMVRRVIKAQPHQVFHAWTSPHALTMWWGLAGIECPTADVNLVEGGEYRIANLMPDGNLLWITGTFEEIVPDEKLVFTWLSGKDQQEPERVRVYFKPVAEGTEVVVVHERIVDDETVTRHRTGWTGCLDGLERYVKTVSTHSRPGID